MLVLLVPAALAGTLAPGEPLTNALGVHLSQGGLDNLAQAIAGVVPSSFEQALIEGEFTCDESDEAPLSYALHDLVVGIAVDEAALVASEGRLDLDLDLSLTASASALEISGDCTFVFDDLTQSCGLEITAEDPIDLDLHLGLTLALLEDGTVDAEVDDLSYTLSTIGNPLHDCEFADVIDALLGLNPDFLSDLVRTFIDPELEGLDETLEASIEEALAGLSFETSLALLDAEIALRLYPAELDLSEDGVLLGLAATASVAELGTCADFGEGSTVSSEGWPAVGESAWDEGGLPYDAALLVNKDFVDHVLWNAWASGVFCASLADLADLQFDTDFVGGLYGESFTALFPVPQPVEMVLSSPNQPTARFDDEVPFWIDLNTLGIDTLAPLDARTARICQVGIDGAIGIDPGLSATSLVPELVIEAESFTYTEPYNELIDPGYSNGLAELLPTLLGNLLPALPTAEIPTWQGIGLKEVTWLPSDDGQWQGGFATLDTENVEPLELGGCGGCGGDTGDTGGGGFEDLLGCTDTGCDSGCSEGGSCATGGRARGGLALLAALVALVGLRRRR